jgi:hypothetical protein
VLWLAVAVILAVAIGVGTALALNKNNDHETAANAGNTSSGTPTSTTIGSTAGTGVPDTTTTYKSVNALNDPTTVLPSGWSAKTVTAAAVGSPAVTGFTIDLPPGWKEQRSGIQTNFYGPDNMLLTVDLSAQSTSDMIAAANSVEKQAVAGGTYPDYKQVAIDPVPVRHTHGAVWKFTWNRDGTPYTADDIFYHAPTSAGTQDYALYFRSPTSNFSKETLPAIESILRTFQIVITS